MQCDNFYTYIYYDPSRSHEPLYVGKGNTNRAWDHLTSKSKKPHPFIHRLRFMKRNNIVPIIGMYSGLDEELALFLEEELISKFGRKDLGHGPLLNLTNGGEGMSGNIRSPETRKKISIANIGKDRTHTQKSKDKISATKSGVKDSDETKIKKSIANTGIFNNKAKLTEQQVIEIFRSDESLGILAVRYDISKPQIYSIKNRIYWKSVTKDLP